MRLLITGGAGFIGSNLAREAARHGHDVTVLDDLSTGRRENLDGLPVRLIEGSVTEPDDVQAALAGGADSIVHLAALASVPRSLDDPLEAHDVNVTGTLLVLEAARRAGVPHVVVASSSAVYGLNESLPKTERDWVRPVSPYGVTKLAAEQYVLAYQESFGLATLAFRFFNVYGPGQAAGHPYAAVIPIFVDAVLRGAPVPLDGDGLQSRDFTFVGTVARVLLEAAERRLAHPEPVNLAYGTNTTVVDLLSSIEALTGIRPTVERRPARLGDVRHSQADNRVLLELFEGVAPVPLVDGLAETVAWFRASAPTAGDTVPAV